VVLLGTGTPNAEPDRSGPATAVVVDGVPYVVDCGPGVVRRAAAARRQGVAGLAASRLARLFLTHLHSDHTVGLPDLIFTPWVLERKEPLRIYGPPGTARMSERLRAAYDEDIRVRLDGLEPANPTGYEVEVHEIEPGVVYADERVTVKAFRVVHGAWKEAFGFRFETPDRTIVISGDTRPCPGLIEAARGADLLIHEVYSHARFQKRAPIWQRYHAQSHTSTLELAKIARQVRPRLLVLTHQLLWGATHEDLLAEIASVYDGPVVSGRDLDRF
jgi:ribonuclease BN (tRNA processing enzyme)